MTAVAAVQRPRTVDRGGIVAALAIAAAVGLASWLRHQNHWTGFDLAIFDQGVWQISEGRTHISIVERHVMADHFSPVLYLFGVLYRIHATPAWFFAMQAIAIGSTVLPVRAIARHFGQPAARGTYLVAISAPLLAAAFFDFHPSTLAVPFMAATILYALRDRPGAATVTAILAVLCRADLALVLFSIAIVAAVRTRWRLVAIGVVAAGVSAIVPGLFGDTNGWRPHFGHLGASPVQAVLHPWDVAVALLSGKSLATYGLWVLASGVAIVLRPRWLVALAVAGLPILLSRWEGTGLPWYHYGAPMAPIAISGSLAGLQVAASRSGRLAERLRTLWWLGPIIAALLSPLSPLAPEGNRVWKVLVESNPRDVAAALEYIEPDDAVSADQYVLAQVARREHAYIYAIPFEEAPDFFAEGTAPRPDDYDPDAVDVVVSTQGHEHRVGDPRFKVVARPDALVVLRRDGSGSDEEPAP